MSSIYIIGHYGNYATPKDSESDSKSKSWPRKRYKTIKIHCERMCQDENRPGDVRWTELHGQGCADAAGGVGALGRG